MIILPKFPLVLLIFNPKTLGLESLAIKEDEVALAVLLGPVAQCGDHDIAISQTVSGVGCAHSLGMELPWLDDLVQLWTPGVGQHVHDVDSVGPKSGDDQS